MSLLKKFCRRILPDRRPFILAYHRVKDVEIDPWGMAVTPKTFELQVKALAGRTGGKLSRAIFRNSTPRAYITFDDGYSDNFEYALPILKKHHVQATVFLATGFLGSSREYWWDRLERIFLLPGSLPEILDLHVLDDHYRLPLRGDAIYTGEDFQRHRCWRPGAPPPTTRHLLFATLWSVLHRADRAYQDAMIAELEEWAGCGSDPRKDYPPMTAAQVREMADNGIHFGAHTVNHISAHHCPGNLLAEEVSESKQRVEEITGREANVFSYPFGQTNDAIQAVLADLQIDVACTSQKNRLNPETARLLTPRIIAGNESLPLIQRLLR